MSTKFLVESFFPDTMSLLQHLQPEIYDWILPKETPEECEAPLFPLTEEIDLAYPVLALTCLMGVTVGLSGAFYIWRYQMPLV